MALSGTINGSVTQKSNYFSFYLKWSATQNVSGNYSDVTVTTYWATNNIYKGFDTSATRNASITINGTTTSITKRFNVCASGSTSWASTPYKIQTATTRVFHKDDGTKSITISARANGHAASYGPSSSTATSDDCTASATITLDTIPRASSITSVGTVTLGNKCSVKWTPASSSFKYKIKFSLGSWSYTTDYISPNTTSAYTYSGYTIPDIATLLDDIPNSETGSMTATLYTYNSSNTQIGTASSKNFTVKVPAGVVPTVGTITLNPADINSQNILIQGKNKLTISVSGWSAGTGSSIKSYTFSGPGISNTTTSTSVTSNGTISNTGTLTYKVTLTDSRGRTNFDTATIPCYAYAQPSFSTFSAYRCTSNGTADESGNYVNVSYRLTYSNVNNTNDVTVKIFYKKATATSWSQPIDVLTNSTSTSGNKIISGIDAASTYSIYMTVSDNYGGNASSSTITIFGESRIFNVRPNGNGIAFGKMAESDDLLESKWPAKFDKGITIGVSTQDSAPIGGIAVHDVRNVTVIPNSFGDKNANFYFDQIDDNWYSILHMKGWTGDYAAWELAGNANSTSNDSTLKYRQGIGSAWGDWQNVMMRTSLYSNATGTTGTITLSHSAEDFSFLEIFYLNNNNIEAQSTRVFSPNGQVVELSCVEASETDSSSYIRTSLWLISGKSMTHQRSKYISLTANQYPQVATNQYIKIIRVVGYK